MESRQKTTTLSLSAGSGIAEFTLSSPILSASVARAGTNLEKVLFCYLLLMVSLTSID